MVALVLYRLKFSAVTVLRQNPLDEVRANVDDGVRGPIDDRNEQEVCS
jgi:hypothetical protein